MALLAVFGHLVFVFPDVAVDHEHQQAVQGAAGGAVGVGGEGPVVAAFEFGVLDPALVQVEVDVAPEGTVAVDDGGDFVGAVGAHQHVAVPDVDVVQAGDGDFIQQRFAAVEEFADFVQLGLRVLVGYGEVGVGDGVEFAENIFAPLGEAAACGHVGEAAEAGTCDFVHPRHESAHVFHDGVPVGAVPLQFEHAGVGHVADDHVIPVHDIAGGVQRHDLGHGQARFAAEPVEFHFAGHQRALEGQDQVAVHRSHPEYVGFAVDVHAVGGVEHAAVQQLCGEFIRAEMAHDDG